MEHERFDDWMDIAVLNQSSVIEFIENDIKMCIWKAAGIFDLFMNISSPILHEINSTDQN